MPRIGFVFRKYFAHWTLYQEAFGPIKASVMSLATFRPHETRLPHHWSLCLHLPNVWLLPCSCRVEGRLCNTHRLTGSRLYCWHSSLTANMSWIFNSYGLFRPPVLPPVFGAPVPRASVCRTWNLCPKASGVLQMNNASSIHVCKGNVFIAVPNGLSRTKAEWKADHHGTVSLTPPGNSGQLIVFIKSIHGVLLRGCDSRGRAGCPLNQGFGGSIPYPAASLKHIS